LASEEPKTPDVILARITEEIEGLGQRRWPGSLKSLKPPRPGPGGGVAANAADTSPASSNAADSAAASVDPAAPAVTVTGQSPARGKVCGRWQTTGCKNPHCKRDHPNGKRQCPQQDRVCGDWWFGDDGCLRDKCQYKHPNGKSKRDRSAGESTFNKRDLTPVGQRHTPVDATKYIYDKGEPVKADPKAAEAHERKQNPRVKMRDPQSD
jgi:hypothetical protein